MDVERKDGLRPAFEAAYAEHKKSLLTLAVALTGERHAAEDVVHDVFARLLRDTARLGNGHDTRGYLATCVRNRAVDVLRTRSRHARHVERVGRDRETHAPPAALCVAQDEESDRLLCAVAALPDPLRETLSLRIWGGMSFERIAELQGTVKSTAHARYAQALTWLQNRMMGDAKDD